MEFSLQDVDAIIDEIVVEIPENQLKLFSDAKAIEKVVEALRGLGFKYVTLDLEGFQSGSMLRTLEMDRI